MKYRIYGTIAVSTFATVVSVMVLAMMAILIQQPLLGPKGVAFVTMLVFMFAIICNAAYSAMGTVPLEQHMGAEVKNSVEFLVMKLMNKVDLPGSFHDIKDIR